MVYLECKIQSHQLKPSKKGKILHIYTQADGKPLTLKFFFYSPYILQKIETYQWVRCYGEVQADFGLSMLHPEMDFVQDPSDASTTA
jgi:RecG-like helicase